MKLILLSMFLCFSLIGVAQSHLTLHLLANYTTHDTITAGEPVMLQLQLYNAHAEYAAVENAAIEQNLSELEAARASGKCTQEEYEAEKATLEEVRMRIDTVVIPGSTLKSQLKILLDGEMLRDDQYNQCGAEPTEQEYHLSTHTRLLLLFGINSGETTKWIPGNHTLVMAYDSLSSDTTHLAIIPAIQDTNRETIRGINMGYFYLDCGDPAQSLVIANELLESSPDFLDAVTLKADYFMATRDTTQALEWYEKALRLFHRQYPDSYELPEYLLDQIAALKRQE